MVATAGSYVVRNTAARMRERMLLQMEECLPAVFALEFGGRRVQTVGFCIVQFDDDENEIQYSHTYSFDVEHDPRRLHDADFYVSELECALEPDDPQWSTERPRLDFNEHFSSLFPIFDSDDDMVTAFASHAIVSDAFEDRKILAPYCLWHKNAHGTIRRTVVGAMHRPAWEDGSPDFNEHGSLAAPPAPSPAIHQPSQTVLAADALTRERVLMQIEECLPRFLDGAAQPIQTLALCITQHKDPFVAGVSTYSTRYRVNGMDWNQPVWGSLPHLDDGEVAAFAAAASRVHDAPDLTVTCCLWHKEPDGTIFATRAPLPVVATSTSTSLPSSTVLLVWVVSAVCALGLWALRMLLLR